jgi:uncharacterized protein (TIGR02147 family)
MLFDHDDYRRYLRIALDEGHAARGRRSRLAQFLKCQTSFISQVLSGRSHLSLEHALRASEFLAHTGEERDFFMLLVQKAKAGSKELEIYYGAQIEQARSCRQVVKERIKVKDELKLQDQITYYSAWWYGAVHVLCALPGTQTREQIAAKLSLPVEVVEKTLSFLEEKGLISENGGRYGIGKRRIVLGSSSPLLPRHHANWRMRAMQSVDHAKATDLRYSGVIALSRQDAARVRSVLLDALQKSEAILKETDEEAPYVMLMDLFEM